MHTLRERGRVEKKGEYEEGLLPLAVEYEDMELVSRVLTLPENGWWLYAH